MVGEEETRADDKQEKNRTKSSMLNKNISIIIGKKAVSEIKEARQQRI